jgi:hypothetical protein
MAKRIDEFLLSVALRSQDYRISPEYQLPKRFILQQVSKIPARIDLYTTMALFRGLGKTEWEVLLAYIFLDNIEEAEAKGEDEVDITNLFARDYSDQSGRNATKEQVYEHLIRYFTVSEETDSTIYLTFNIKE